MKNRAIYYMDGQTTVCLLQENGEIVARGISICSRSDMLDTAEGRRYARNRALEARGRQQNCAEIKLGIPRTIWFDIVHLSLACDRFGKYKGYYYPTLTPTERILLELKK